MFERHSGPDEKMDVVDKGSTRDKNRDLRNRPKPDELHTKGETHTTCEVDDELDEEEEDGA